MLYMYYKCSKVRKMFWQANAFLIKIFVNLLSLL